MSSRQRTGLRADKVGKLQRLWTFFAGERTRALRSIARRPYSRQRPNHSRTRPPPPRQSHPRPAVDAHEDPRVCRPLELRPA